LGIVQPIEGLTDTWGIGPSAPFEISILVSGTASDVLPTSTTHAKFEDIFIDFSIGGETLAIEPGPTPYIDFTDNLVGTFDVITARFDAELDGIIEPIVASVRLPTTTFSIPTADSSGQAPFFPPTFAPYGGTAYFGGGNYETHVGDGTVVVVTPEPASWLLALLSMGAIRWRSLGRKQ